MRNTSKMASALAAVALAFGMGSAQAALWNFTLSGEVVYADTPNDYNLASTSPVTVVGIFDDSVLTGGTGTISFATGNPYGNTFTVTAGDILFTPNEVFAGTPSLTLNSMTVNFISNGFSFYATDTDTATTFNSYFSAFDGEDTNFALMSGDWLSFSTTPVVVPVPAAVWLLGSGLLGLAGITRRKTTA